jgi:hypothetical protein
MKLTLTSLLQVQWEYNWVVVLATSLKCYVTSWLSPPIASENPKEIQGADLLQFLAQNGSVHDVGLTLNEWHPQVYYCCVLLVWSDMT